LIESQWSGFSALMFLTRGGQGRRVTEVGPNEAFFFQGDLARSIFYLHKGRAKATVMPQSGREAAITLINAGEFFGEESLHDIEERRPTTARAITRCTALQIDRDEMTRELHKDPVLSDIFLDFMLKRTIRIQADLIDQLLNSSEKRLARILLLMARCGTHEAFEANIPPITQEALANMVGTTRSRVNFFMNRFRNQGLIEYRKSICVHKELLTVILERANTINSPDTRQELL
jgi:CRP/FNR family cyclic AMP-dependent transcriptional regulator